MADVKVERKKITDLIPDPENANEGTERGLRILDDIVTDLGAGRSGLVDKNGLLIAGNKTQERLVDHGFEDVIVVHAKPTEWVVVQRDDFDLTDSDPANPARRMAYYDNVASQHMQWNVAQLLKDKERGVDLSKLWTKDELAALVADAQKRNSGQQDAATQRDQIAEAHQKWGAKLGDLWLIPSATRLGVHRVICGDATDEGVVKRLLDGLPSQPNLMVTDPPYGVEYDPAWRQGIHPEQQYALGKVQNDDRVDWSQAYRLFPGNVAYVWHAGKFASQVEVTLIASGFETRYHIVWVKQQFVMSRGDYHWQHEPCQPAGTLVRTPKGEVPIETLRDGDRVLSYDSYSSVITGKRDGREVKVAQRAYEGDMYSIRAAGRCTQATDGHRFSVRFASKAEGVWCSYLMRRGNWWRVGIIKTFNSRGFGLRVRVKDESADEAWILSTHTSHLDAICAEQVISVKYGIPTTHFGGKLLHNKDAHRQRTFKQIQGIYDHLDLRLMERNAHQALSDYGRRVEYPLVVGGSDEVISRSKTSLVRAANLIPCIMELPIPKDYGDEFDWVPIDSVERRFFNGTVYSLDVEKDHHYIADGIVTHNCWYMVRKGATGNWQGSRKETTTWFINNLNPFGQDTGESEDERTGHGTQKPIECMRRPMLNNSAPGEYVYDPFLGSGTTIAAAEACGRYGVGCELDPQYVSVILERLSQLGLTPERIS